MIKLTELKRMIKTNTYRACFYSEGVNNVIFNYSQQILLELNQIDKEKLFNHLISIQYVHDDLSLKSFFFDAELKVKLEKLKGNKYDHKYNLVNTGIEFKKDGQWESNDKISYQVFKTSKGLLKIKTECICLFDQKEIYFKTNESHSMIFIYNNTNDCIGVCMGEKFDMDELIEYTQWGS